MQRRGECSYWDREARRRKRAERKRRREIFIDGEDGKKRHVVQSEQEQCAGRAGSRTLKSECRWYVRLTADAYPFRRRGCKEAKSSRGQLLLEHEAVTCFGCRRTPKCMYSGL